MKSHSSVLQKTILAVMMTISGHSFAVAQNSTPIANGMSIGDEIIKLANDKQYDQAMVKIEQALAMDKKNPQIRFYQGIILAEQNKVDSAISVFRSLTEDYPELPEPYNNLAVLYEGKGDFLKARTALEVAIKTNPAYAIAFENLGDIYAKSASEAYEKALQLEPGNLVINSKLKLVKELYNKPFELKDNPALAVSATEIKPMSAMVAPVNVNNTANNAMVQQQQQPLTIKPVTPVVVNNTNSAMNDVAKDKKMVGADPKKILAVVTDWANAWADKDLNAYFASYGDGFNPKGGRKAWEKDRSDKITSKKSIEVAIENPVVKVNGDIASVEFTQNYRGDAVKNVSKKVLTLRQVRPNVWLIENESSR
jgi:tetratricopeptide (TPR) repeat protein